MNFKEFRSITAKNSDEYIDTVKKVKEAEYKADIERWSSVHESGWHRRNPEKVGSPADPDYDVLKGKGKPVKDSKPSTTGKASKKPPGIYKPNKEGKFVKVDEAKVDTGSAEDKATARNKRNTPPGKDSKFDTSVFITRKPGESLDSARTRKRRDAHAAKRGVKEDYKKLPVAKMAKKISDKSFKSGQSGVSTKSAEQTGKMIGVLDTHDPQRSKAKSKIKEDKAFDNVVAALRKKHGKDAVLTKDSPKPKSKPQPKRKPEKDTRSAAQREVDAQYGRTPWNKKGSLGT